MRILQIENELPAAQVIELMAKNAKCTIKTAYSCEQGLQLTKHQKYDVLLLSDYARTEGESLLFEHRRSGNAAPVIILASEFGHEARIRWLNYGADDCITRPFYVEELLERIRAVVRRCRRSQGLILSIGDLSIDTESKEVSVSDKKIHLTDSEYHLIVALVKRAEYYVEHSALPLTTNKGVRRNRKALQMTVRNAERKLSEVTSSVLIEGHNVHGYKIRDTTPRDAGRRVHLVQNN